MADLRHHITQVDDADLGEAIREVLEGLRSLEHSGLLVDAEKRLILIGKAVDLVAQGGSFGSHLIDWMIHEAGLERRSNIRGKKKA